MQTKFQHLTLPTSSSQGQEGFGGKEMADGSPEGGDGGLAPTQPRQGWHHSAPQAAGSTERPQPKPGCQSPVTRQTPEEPGEQYFPFLCPQRATVQIWAVEELGRHLLLCSELSKHPLACTCTPLKGALLCLRLLGVGEMPLAAPMERQEPPGAT